MKLSIIIPTYNEGGELFSCIDSLKNQTETDYELIVVDDGSDDGTTEKLKNLKTQKLTILKQDHQGPGAARNLGASHAKGEILVFVDADMEFDKHFLKNLVKPIVSGKSRGTFSKKEYVKNWENVWARCWNYNQNWEDKKRHPKNYPDFQPVFRAILASEFKKVSGFDQGGYDDDWSLERKLGYKAENAENAIFYHKNPSTLKEVYAQARWSGKRNYKLGVIGKLIALVRASLPVSLAIGIFKTIKYGEYRFLMFKIVYDFGIFMGIINFLFTGKASK